MRNTTLRMDRPREVHEGDWEELNPGTGYQSFTVGVSVNE